MNDLLLSGGTVVDGSGTEPYAGEIAVRDGVVVPPGAGRNPRVLDVTGCTVMPGLIDAHTHLGIVANKEGAQPWAVTAGQIFDNARIALDAGFTTVRDVGGLDGGIVQALSGRYQRGPRVLPSGPIISEAGGNGDLLPAFACCSGGWQQGLPGLSTIGAACRGVDDVRVAARLALRRGATQLKVSVNTLDALEATGVDTELSLPEVRAAVEEARAKRTYVTAHTMNSAGIRLGLQAGVECFEHSGVADEQVARLLVAAGAPLVPTLTQAALFEGDDRVPAHERAFCRAFRLEMERSLLLAAEHGVLVGLGSDLEGVDQVHRGSELTRRAALQSPMAALVAATSTNAAVIRRPDLGRLVPGCIADIAVIQGDPLADPTLFDRPELVVLVVQGGVVVKDLTG